GQAPAAPTGGRCPRCANRPWADSERWGVPLLAAPPKARSPERVSQSLKPLPYILRLPVFDAMQDRADAAK
ncbi:hypothetical protein KFY64_25165, partial [Salmonella enterica subsp. enterica serovar 1,4,[5],12:i:-]|nr:hypothetical protein [Salmonella enterica subsp. enterica serovar 1,4,[5],12:i:-]